MRPLLDDEGGQRRQCVPLDLICLLLEAHGNVEARLRFFVPVFIFLRNQVVEDRVPRGLRIEGGLPTILYSFIMFLHQAMLTSNSVITPGSDLGLINLGPSVGELNE